MEPDENDVTSHLNAAHALEGEEMEERSPEALPTSVIKNFQDPGDAGEFRGSAEGKVLSLEKLLGGIAIKEEAGSRARDSEHREDQISASTELSGKGRPPKKKAHERPIHLNLRYERELIIVDDANKKEVEAHLRRNRVVVVDLANVQEHAKELVGVLRDCMKTERMLTTRLDFKGKEHSSDEDEAPAYITTGSKTFYITRRKLMGEILRAHQKAERLKQEAAPLSTISAIEKFAKKLCVLKIHADKLLLS